MKWMTIQIGTIVLALAAATISFGLYLKHVSGEKSMPLIDLGCSASGEGGAFDCGAVMKSRWSMYPPTEEGKPPDPNAVPVAFLGWMYFSALTVWLIGVGRPSPQRWWIHLFPLAMTAVGLYFSVQFIYIMAAKVDAWCPWCVATHACNFLIFGALLWMWPRAAEAGAGAPVRAGGAGAGTSAESEHPTAKPVAAQGPVSGIPIAEPLAWGPPHPSCRLVLVTLAAMFFVYLFQGQVLSEQKKVARLVNEREQYRAMLEQFRTDGKQLFERWFRGKGVEIPERPDDPEYRKPGQKTMPVVVFSDFQCPQCRRVAENMRDMIQPLFNGYVRIVYKYYPLNSKCNPYSVDRHPQACLAARAAEAARMQGGNDKFWELHDWMFSNQNKLAMLDTEDGVRTFARQFDLDVERFIRDMNSDAVTRRIVEDVELGKKLGIKATPTVYLMGKKLNNYFDTNNMNFWRQVAVVYWDGIIKRPPPPDVKALMRGEKDPPAASSPVTTEAESGE